MATWKLVVEDGDGTPLPVEDKNFPSFDDADLCVHREYGSIIASVGCKIETSVIHIMNGSERIDTYHPPKPLARPA